MYRNFHIRVTIFLGNKKLCYRRQVAQMFLYNTSSTVFIISYFRFSAADLPMHTIKFSSAVFGIPVD